LRDAINWCIENPVLGRKLAPDSADMRALESTLNVRVRAWSTVNGKRYSKSAESRAVPRRGAAGPRQPEAARRPMGPPADPESSPRPGRRIDRRGSGRDGAGNAALLTVRPERRGAGGAGTGHRAACGLRKAASSLRPSQRLRNNLQSSDVGEIFRVVHN
jgi:hypothetical protein